jgi:subfamily B ATP-binding cassette protein MsbA
MGCRCVFFEVLEVENEIISKCDYKKHFFWYHNQNINFKYEDDYVLKNFSFQVKKDKPLHWWDSPEAEKYYR